MAGERALPKVVKTKKKKRRSIDILTDDTLKEMQKLFEGEEALSVVKSVILDTVKSIDTDTKSDEAILILSKLLTMMTSNSKTMEIELKITWCFLLKIFQKFPLQNIKKLSTQPKRYADLLDDNDKILSEAVRHEERLLELNEYLTNMESASKDVIGALQDNVFVTKFSTFLCDLKFAVSQLMHESEVKSARRATAYVNLYFKISMLHSFVLWHFFCIKSRSACDQNNTKGVYTWIIKNHTYTSEMLRYITHPNVENGLFLSVCHISENENILNRLQIQDIPPFVFEEGFFDRKHYIHWGKSQEVKLQMKSCSYGVFGTTSVTEKSEFKFISVNGREMDSICYIKSAYWENYYMRMSEDGSCDAVKNVPKQGGEWKFVPLDIKQEHQMFIICSVDWPENFLYLESEGRSVKGESDLKKIEENGQWTICDVKREHETPGLNSANA